MADNTLDLLVKLGVIGKDDVKAVNDLLKETGDAHVKAAEGAKFFSGEGREVHRIIGEINRALPGTGNLFREAFNPSALGAVGILVGLLVEAKGALDDYNKKLDEAGEKAAEPLDGGVIGLQTAWDDAQKSLGKYLAELKTAGEDEDSTTRQIKAAKEISDARIEGTKKEIEAQGKLEEATIRALEAGQDPAKIEADVQRAQARTGAKIANLSASQKPEDLQRELTLRQQAEPSLEAAAAATQGNSAERRASNNEEELKNLRAANAGSAKAGTGPAGLTTIGDVQALEDLMNRAQKAQKAGDIVGIAETDKEFAELGGRSGYDAKLATARAALVAQRTRQQQLEATEKIDEENAEAEKKIREAAQKNLAVNQARLQELPDELKTAQTVAGTQTQSAATVAALTARTQAATDIASREKNGQSAQDILTSGATGAEDIRNLARSGFGADRIKADYQRAVRDQSTGHGTELDAAAIQRYQRFATDQSQVNVLNQLLETLGGQGVAMLTIMQHHFAYATSFQSEIKALQVAYANLTAQLHTAP